MAAPRRQQKALQLIFAFFLGLMVTAFMGVGVFTFYPSNLEPLEDQARELRDQQQEVRDARTAEGLTDEQHTGVFRERKSIEEHHARRR